MLRPHLIEVRRRLRLGAEAAELGPDGVAVVAKAIGVAADTLRRGHQRLIRMPLQDQDAQGRPVWGP